MAITAYCMKCRAKRDVKNPKAIVHPNGKDATTGVCSVCGTRVFRMGRMPTEAPTPTKVVAGEPETGEPKTKEPGAKGKRSKVKIS